MGGISNLNAKFFSHVHVSVQIDVGSCSLPLATDVFGRSRCSCRAWWLLLRNISCCSQSFYLFQDCIAVWNPAIPADIEMPAENLLCCDNWFAIPTTISFILSILKTSFPGSRLPVLTYTVVGYTIVVLAVRTRCTYWLGNYWRCTTNYFIYVFFFRTI